MHAPRPFLPLCRFLVLVAFPGLVSSTPLNAWQTSWPVEEKELASKFLEQFWGEGQENRRGAEEAWIQKPASISEGGMAAASYAVNRIRHRNLREGLEAAAGLGDQFADDWEIWHLRIWSEMAAGNPNEALLLMQKLKSRLAQVPPPDAAVRFSIFSRLGRLIAFAEGPARDKVRDTTLAETLAIVTEGLSDEDRKAFDDHRLQTGNQYVALVNEVSGNIDLQLQQSAEKNAKESERIEQENQSIAALQEGIGQQMSAVRERQTVELGGLEAQAVPLRGELTSLNSRWTAESQRAAWLIADINHLEYLAAHEPDPVLRNSLLAQAASARIALASHQSLVAQLQAQRNSVLAQLNSIESQLAAAASRFAGELRALEDEQRRLAATLKKNARALSRLGEPETEPGYVRSSRAQISQLATYDPFPVDELRHHLLEELE